MSMSILIIDSEDGEYLLQIMFLADKLIKNSFLINEGKLSLGKGVGRRKAVASFLI